MLEREENIGQYVNVSLATEVLKEERRNRN
jgi:hypothetical protein